MDSKLNILVESRIHGDVYVRFGGEYMETYYSDIARRWVLSLRIYIPGAIARDVAKQSLSQDIQGISIGTLDPSLGAQAASAGIQTVKTLMGKKTRLRQVHLKAGYQVLLKDGNAGV